LSVTVVKRSDDTKGFVVLPRRWVVERTLGWLTRNRRAWFLLAGGQAIGDFQGVAHTWSR
jgi:transposase